MLTVSNDNKTRVDFHVYKEVTETLRLVKQASDTLNDTGDVESTTLDNASSHLKCAIDMLTLFLQENS